MVEGEYAKYFINEPMKPGTHNPFPKLKLNAGDYFRDKNYSLVMTYVDKPCVFQPKTHTHDFDQFLHFWGADGTNMGEFDAEVEIVLGEAGLKHIITKTTIVHVPKDMLHCPITFTRVDKPVFFMNIALTPEYNLKWEQILMK